MSEKKELMRAEEEVIWNEMDDLGENDMESPPTYSSIFEDASVNSSLLIAEDDEKSPAAFEKVTNADRLEDGRFSIDLSAGSRTSAVLQTLVIPAQIPRVIDITSDSKPRPPPQERTEETFQKYGVSLDIVLMLVGTRDEIKSCISVGHELQRQGHRVRVVTHSIFQNIVMKLGLEFFSASSDPEHPIAKQDSGLMPGLSSPNKTEIRRNSKMLLDSLKACWIACTHPGRWKERPFLADAIIATPLAHAHIHCAERLSIPLHIMSTTPWTPTKSFAHPLAQIRLNDGVDRETQNYLSHILIEDTVWHEIYYVVDHFRRSILGLPQIPLEDSAGLLRRSNIPHTFLVSSALIPRPEDWDNQIDISGYVTADHEVPYTPPEDLVQFLEKAVAPIYVSLHIDLLNSPERFIYFLKEASNKYGFAFLLPSHFESVSGISDSHFFVLHNVPIDWLIPKIEVLITHGDADMVSMGLGHGKPMVTLPVIRDQPFWASAVSQVGAGPIPIHEKGISSEEVAQAIRQCLQPETRKISSHIKEGLAKERGLANAVSSFYRHLQWENMQCDLTKTSPAVYHIEKGQSIKLSAAAAAVLVRSNAVRRSDLNLIKRREYDTTTEVAPEVPPSAPVTKSVGKNLIKAIIKPTVSHIADAYNEMEARDDTDAANSHKFRGKSKKGMAVGAARNAGFVSAVFLGKVAMLPFKTVYYMGETASYSVKSLQGSTHSEKQKDTSTNESEMASECDIGASIDEKRTETIRNLHFEKGRRDERLRDPEFTKTVLSKFEDICTASLTNKLDG
ncbi:uncharacterized protein N7496_011585 [Penicillium cataractarum]|uniref:Glycosyltransferase family 28 N-terminal domain-containing protein n=1 Tax=Penicillium cataractarum TaxID=2100454 RepID=A0A9W9UVR1_9EURO|nr:uncharacterized protein N7496_011585 [Penicillium cataractarum]KAJ5359172.1 hypothetical protein N7496_011585 [Penicillium cataractarum]